MNPSLSEFRHLFRNLVLDFLWRQWSALGVAGSSEALTRSIIDVEALLLFTCTMGRHDPRLFDEMLDWLQVNGRFINIMRLKRILRMERFAGQRALAAVASCLMRGSDALKWRLLAQSVQPESELKGLFVSPDGSPLAVVGEPEPHFARFGLRRGPLRLRGRSRRFRPVPSTNLVLQLRALLGINVRCEIVLYLLTHEAAHPSQIAREAYYFERAIQGTLVDMSRSGVVRLRASAREKHYWLLPQYWAALLDQAEPWPQWTTWPPLFSALEQIWLKLSDPGLEGLDPLLQSSELRQLMLDVRPALQRARFDTRLSDDRNYLGADYLPVFISDVMSLLE
jgi:hypothetical protein